MGLVEANVETRIDESPCVHPLLAVSLASSPINLWLTCRHSTLDDMVQRVSCIHQETCITARSGGQFTLRRTRRRTRMEGCRREDHHDYVGLRRVLSPHEYVLFPTLSNIGRRIEMLNAGLRL